MTEEALNRWLQDPVVGKLVVLVAGLVVIRLLLAVAHRWVGRHVQDVQIRYRARKGSTAFAYLVAFLLSHRHLQRTAGRHDARLRSRGGGDRDQNWVELTLRYVVDYKARRVTKDRVFTRVLEEIDATGGRVGIAAATLNIEKLAPLEIRLADEVRVRGVAEEL